MNADGSNRTHLTKNIFATDLCFSPDGKKIAYISTNQGEGTIYVMNADGTQPVRLVSGVSVKSNLCFSPNGRRMAFATEREDGSEIYLMDVDGTHRTLLTKTDYHVQLSWAPGFVPASEKAH